MKIVSTNLLDLKIIKKHRAVLEGYNKKFVFAEIEEIQAGRFICFIVCGDKKKEIVTRETMRAAKLTITNWYKKNTAKRGERIWKAWKWEEIK